MKAQPPVKTNPLPTAPPPEPLTGEQKQFLQGVMVVAGLMVGGLVLTGAAVPILSRIWGGLVEIANHPMASLANGLWYVGVAMMIGAFALFVKWSAGDEVEPKLVESFRDQSPYGDANLADRESIQRAMMGHQNPSAPQFEE